MYHLSELVPLCLSRSIYLSPSGFHTLVPECPWGQWQRFKQFEFLSSASWTSGSFTTSGNHLLSTTPTVAGAFLSIWILDPSLAEKKGPNIYLCLNMAPKTFQPKLVQDGFKITLCSYTYWEWARSYKVHCSISFASFQDGALTRSPPYAISNQTKNRHYAPFLFHIILFPRSVFITKTI